MAQSAILAVGVAPGVSTDVVVATGVWVQVGIYSDSKLPVNVQAYVYADTPSVDNLLKVLDISTPMVAIQGPCTVRVVRPACSANVGVYLET